MAPGAATATTVANDDKADLGFEKILTGSAHPLCGIRRPTKDGGDGTAVVNIEVPAEALPEEYVSSVVGSVWAMTIRETMTEPQTAYAQRLAITETKNGRVMVRLSVIAADLAPDALYGHSGKPTIVEIALTANHPRHSLSMERSERTSVLKRACIACAEAEFETWIGERLEAAGLPPVGRPRKREGDQDGHPSITAEDRSAEMLLRLARIHSRGDIAESTIAADAVDQILRAYRSAIWHGRRS